MPKISIIIPVYNAEKYLERCVNSVLASLNEIDGEILLVDNCSSDGSLEEARRLEKHNKSIISVLQCNTPGASAARNLGVKRARGEFIWFIDADDYIAPDAIPELLAKTQGSDLIMMGAERISRSGKKSYLSAVDSKERDYKSRFIRYGMGPWQVVIRREWWNRHKFNFKEGIIHEDMELMSALILYTDKLTSINKPLYFYCDTPESVLHQAKFNPHIFDIFPALKGLYQRFTQAGAEQKYHDELEWFFIWNLLIDSAKDFKRFPEGRPGFAQSRQMLKKYYPNWRKNRFLKQKPLKLQIMVRLNYYRRGK